MDKEQLLDNRHWQIEDFRQRMTREEWKKLLLDYDDTVIYKGLLRKLKATSLGYGVLEVYKEPKKQTPETSG